MLHVFEKVLVRIGWEIFTNTDTEGEGLGSGPQVENPGGCGLSIAPRFSPANYGDTV